MVKDDLWSNLKQKLREVTTAAADFTEEQALIGKLKFETLTLKRKIDGELRDLGARILELSRQTPPTADTLADSLVKRRIREIGELEKLVAKKRDDIGKVADQVRSRRQPTGGGDAQTKNPKGKSTKTAAGKAKTRVSATRRKSS